MGITGLLPLLSSIQKPTNLLKLRGLTIGVDVYVWLHRAAVASAMDIGLGRPTTKFIGPVMNRVKMLQYFGITPYIVFDGDYLPSKAPTEIARAKRRAESLRLGNNLLSMGRKTEANKEFIKAIDITPEMARLLIEELKRQNIQYVVAPYEADAQLAYLESQGLIHGVISEDSDLLVFGVRRLFTKLDDQGNCIEIDRKDFTALRSIQIAGWTDADFRRMAILSGCDYLPNISRIGLKTAYELVRKHKDIERIIRILSLEGKHTIPPNYLEEFTKAELTFLHQRVFCPTQQELVMLSPYHGEEPADFEFIGRHVEPEIARRVALGELNAETKAEIKVVYNVENYRPSPHTLRRSKSVQSDLKGKPIGEFFKSNRIPLAELDPNSFTPSPSQRRTLERQPSTILTTPVLGARNATTISSAPAVLTRTRAPSSGHAISRSKRPRLCADDSRGANEDVLLSKFFVSTQSDPSPLQKMQSKVEDSDHLWSDPALDEALAELPDDLGTPSHVPKLKIFAEIAEPQQDASGDSQESTDKISIARSRSSSPAFEDTLIVSKRNSQPRHSTPKPTASRISVSMESLLKKYTHIPASSTTPIKTPVILDRSASSTLSQKSTYFTRPSSRPSSRLSLTSSSTDIKYPTLPIEPEAKPIKTLKPEAELEPELEPDLPTIIPESPARKTIAHHASSPFKGSEDLLVPRSDDIEDEIEEILDLEDKRRNQLKERPSPSIVERFGLNLKTRFAFTGV